MKKKHSPSHPQKSSGVKKKHPSPSSLIRLEARLDKNRKGFGFLIFDDPDLEDMFLPPHVAGRFFHGDRIAVLTNSRHEVQDFQLVSHRYTKLVGKYQGHHWMVFERKNAREEIHIPHPGHTRAGDWLMVELEYHAEGPHPISGNIIENYGKELSAASDLPIIAAEFNLEEEHTPAAVRQAESYPLDTRDPRRKDLTKIPFITIDGEDARDFDDAIYVERSSEGWDLWVAIADVSHYVTEGTPLDNEAFSRGTSVYFPERAFHMLPRALSENLCSLRPHEPRLAMVAKMHFSKQNDLGKPSRTEIYEAVIHSKRRATYTEIQNEYEANKNTPHWEYTPHFELYEILKKARRHRGAIDFDLQEVKVNVDAQGEPTTIDVRQRADSHRLIEEFMIAANEATTEWMMKKKHLFIYRTHEEPDARSFQKFQRLAQSLGIPVHLPKGGAPKPKELSKLIEQIEKNPAKEALNSALLRSMKQAVYSDEYGIHYGLASTGYTHFTSPIRRYPDLVVHRLIRAALRGHPIRGKAAQSLLEKVATHCSQRERIAAEAERESIKLKQVRALKKHLGHELPARVTGLTENGFFAQVLDPVAEGFVHKDSLGDDQYFFDEDRMMLYGRKKKRIFRIGDSITVRVVRTDIERRQTDLELIGSGGLAPSPSRQTRPMRTPAQDIFEIKTPDMDPSSHFSQKRSLRKHRRPKK